ncbi:mechanosensitive ion channel family protein [Synechococcus sp. 1G10]|uniref:mechanosensitive ion channel family protein n=1 Tax=Synechococcus sp. 1G10 TaxID=2025605 RepID=UPI000B994263|nr:mechanosensitive ion channel domain-containing protein [Synechococcus sp. 1G10]
MSTRLSRWLFGVLGTLALVMVLLQPLSHAAPLLAAGDSTATVSPSPVATAGSYEVANVNILGIPAISVASPVVTSGRAGPNALRRASVIEGNLSLLYLPQVLCGSAQALGEELLESLVLHGSDRACRGAGWGLGGRPDDLKIEVVRDADGLNVLEARLPNHPEPLPLLTVTAADSRFNGMSTDALAKRWRGLLERRLRHARLMLQANALQQRLAITVMVELVVGAVLALSLWLLSLSRRLVTRWQLIEDTNLSLRQKLALQLSKGASSLMFLIVLALGTVMVGLAVMVVPGQIPLGLALLLQPLSALVKVLLVGLLAVLLRLLADFLLHQWSTSLRVPLDERARREQRYRSLLLVSHRLIDLGCIALVVVLILIGIPGVQDASASALVTGGALLGGLAFVFQNLLRDFVAGLLVLIEDRYAIGDFVEIAGLGGTVVDVGVLSTLLRTMDDRVVVIQNASVDVVRAINHTKFRSGVDVRLVLAQPLSDVDRALAVIEAAAADFAADPDWAGKLLKAPWCRGVVEITPLGVDVSVLLTTSAGDQWLCGRELRRRLLRALAEAQLPLARSWPATPP